MQLRLSELGHSRRRAGGVLDWTGVVFAAGPEDSEHLECIDHHGA
jgi:hypothetical protein